MRCREAFEPLIILLTCFSVCHWLEDPCQLTQWCRYTVKTFRL